MRFFSCFTFLIVFLFSFSAFADGYTVPVLDINKTYTIKTPDAPMTPQNTPKYLYEKYIKNTGGYAALYKFKVVPGRAYTFLDCQRGEKSTVFSYLLGRSPLRNSMNKISKPGYFGAAWPRQNPVQRWTDADRGAQCDAYRVNMVIAPDSEHDNLYLLLRSAKPESEITIRLSEPADRSSEVASSTKSPYRPRINRKWGMVLQKPLYLITVPDNLEAGASETDYAAMLMGGATLNIVFDAVGDKFNDNGWQGREDDPLGGVKAGEGYTVNFIKATGGWRMKGFYEESGNVRTFIEKGGDPRENQINLFNRIFFFSANGEVFDKTYGLVGHIQ